MQTNLNTGVSGSTGAQRPQNEWDKIAESSQFKQMIAKKKAFLVPATIFYLVYYFTLPILAGYYKPLMAAKVTQSINFGYVFAVSQFLMAWGLAYLYMKKANQFDETAAEMRMQMKGVKK